MSGTVGIGGVAGWVLGAVAPVLGFGADWWLPRNYSAHGGSMDVLFLWIFWITMVIFVGVELMLVWFLVKYRRRPGRRAVFTHGNTRLEMAWTIVPSVILIALAMYSKGVWDNYRYSPLAEEGDQAQYVVIGERFRWNFIYAGPDGKVGRYLAYPKPSDAKWPQRWDAEKKQKVDVKFAGVAGPASLPHDKAVAAISNYVDQENKLGKDFTDPAGIDDDWTSNAGRPQLIPVDTPITIWLTSKDVIHDYFLPNFRVKLDAVPGMRGEINYKALPGSETVKTYSVDDPAAVGKMVWIDYDTPGVQMESRSDDFWIPDPSDRRHLRAFVRNMKPLTEKGAEKLKELGVKEVLTLTQPYDLVCEELCGQGHGSMRGEVYVLPKRQFANFVHRKEPRATTGPAAVK